MRFLAPVLALALIAGCTIEVARPPSPTASTTAPGATPKPAATKRPPAAPSAAPSGVVGPGNLGPVAPTLGEGEVLRLRIHGGGCLYGECWREYRFHADGRMVFAEGPDREAEHQLAPALVGAVAAEAARADFAALAAKPATGGCPTAYDGSEAIYTFKAPGGPARLATCSHALDAAHPLFQAVAALEKAGQDAVVAAREPASPSPTPVGPAPGPTIGPDDDVLVLRRAGGRCVYGGCETTLTVKADGRYVWTQGPNEKREGRVDQALAAALNTEIYRTDFAAIKAKPFAGTCPPAYDGQEVTYTFGAPTGDEVLPGCTYALDEDQPIFKAALALEAAVRP